MSDPLPLTAVFTPDENGWTMAQLAEWPAVVTCAPTVEEARAMLADIDQRLSRTNPRFQKEGRMWRDLAAGALGQAR